MKETIEILKEIGISKVAFMKYREFGLVDSYKDKRPVLGKKGGGFQYFYEDKVIDQIKEVRRKMSRVEKVLIGARNSFRRMVSRQDITRQRLPLRLAPKHSGLV